MKFLSVCISKLRKLVNVSVVRSTTIESLLLILKNSDERGGRASKELYELRLQLAEKETDLTQLRHTLDMKEFEVEALQDQPVREVPVWVMSPEVYKKFCASFEPPIVNGQSSDHEAAFKLGIQRVLSRIGEQHVSR